MGEKVNLLLYHGTKLPMVRADKRQLEQVLMNLVVNARDAMVEGGAMLSSARNLKPLTWRKSATVR
ncbi:hypothetical protein N9N54_02035 [Planktomarina temperata]|nr:hypothetical protein [Planktomarina temperata]